MSPRADSKALLTDHQSAAVGLAIRVVAFAETVGLVSPAPGPGVTVDEVRAAFDALAKRGVGRHLGPLPQRLTADDLATTSQRMLAAIEGSPMPDVEWPAVIAALGDDLVSRLVGVSASSVQRYRTGERPTPDWVADRLHVITEVVSDLSGSYNDYGIRRWFDRPRAQLDGNTPAGLLRGQWSADDEQVIRVRELARALVGAGL